MQESRQETALKWRMARRFASEPTQTEPSSSQRHHLHENQLDPSSRVVTYQHQTQMPRLNHQWRPEGIDGLDLKERAGHPQQNKRIEGVRREIKDLRGIDESKQWRQRHEHPELQSRLGQVHHQVNGDVDFFSPLRDEYLSNCIEEPFEEEQDEWMPRKPLANRKVSQPQSKLQRELEPQQQKQDQHDSSRRERQQQNQRRRQQHIGDLLVHKMRQEAQRGKHRGNNQSVSPEEDEWQIRPRMPSSMPKTTSTSDNDSWDMQSNQQEEHQEDDPAFNPSTDHFVDMDSPDERGLYTIPLNNETLQVGGNSRRLIQDYFDVPQQAKASANVSRPVEGSHRGNKDQDPRVIEEPAPLSPSRSGYSTASTGSVKSTERLVKHEQRSISRSSSAQLETRRGSIQFGGSEESKNDRSIHEISKSPPNSPHFFREGKDQRAAHQNNHKSAPISMRSSSREKRVDESYGAGFTFGQREPNRSSSSSTQQSKPMHPQPIMFGRRKQAPSSSSAAAVVIAPASVMDVATNVNTNSNPRFMQDANRAPERNDFFDDGTFSRDENTSKSNNSKANAKGNSSSNDTTSSLTGGNARSSASGQSGVDFDQDQRQDQSLGDLGGSGMDGTAFPWWSIVFLMCCVFIGLGGFYARELLALFGPLFGAQFSVSETALLERRIDLLQQEMSHFQQITLKMEANSQKIFEEIVFQVKKSHETRDKQQLTLAKGMEEIRSQIAGFTTEWMKESDRLIDRMLVKQQEQVAAAQEAQQAALMAGMALMEEEYVIEEDLEEHEAYGEVAGEPEEEESLEEDEELGVEEDGSVEEDEEPDDEGTDSDGSTDRYGAHKTDRVHSTEPDTLFQPTKLLLTGLLVASSGGVAFWIETKRRKRVARLKRRERLRHLRQRRHQEEEVVETVSDHWSDPEDVHHEADEDDDPRAFDFVTHDELYFQPRSSKKLSTRSFGRRRV